MIEQPLINKADVVVVGAGLVGLTAAIAFAQQQKNVVLLDAKEIVKTAKPDWDARIYALTERTITWLNVIGVWQYVNQSRVNSIQGMEVWAPQTAKPLVLNAEDANLMQMGCIIESQNLMQACWKVIDALHVKVMPEQHCVKLENASHQAVLTLADGGTLTANLLIGSDGAHSWVRQQLNIGVQLKPFNQTAIVANFEAELFHQHIARQWFAAHETLALLPMPKHMVSMVWTMSTEKAAQVLTLTAAELAQQVQVRAHNVLGNLKPIGQSFAFVLNQQTAHQKVAECVALVGDAAHQVHPMAGQGVNLGFNDVMMLAKLTASLNALQAIGEYGFLRQYERASKMDVLNMNYLTSGLDGIFGGNFNGLSGLASWGMGKLNQQSILKKQLIQRATL